MAVARVGGAAGALRATVSAEPAVVAVTGARGPVAVAVAKAPIDEVGAVVDRARAGCALGRGGGQKLGVGFGAGDRAVQVDNVGVLGAEADRAAEVPAAARGVAAVAAAVVSRAIRAAPRAIVEAAVRA